MVKIALDTPEYLQWWLAILPKWYYKMGWSARKGVRQKIHSI